MVSPGWRSADSLNVRLRRDYRHFNFYQLVRLFLLERRHRQASKLGLRAGHALAGHEELDQTVRFQANLDAAFPGREISDIGREDGDKPLAISTSNYCLAGYQGPLPDTYGEWLRDQLRDGNPDLADFLDLFNHRFNALRYQLKTRHRPALESNDPQQGRTADYLAAVMGLFTSGLAEQLPLPRRTLLGLAGLLANPRRSTPMLEAILRTYLRTAVSIEPLQGGWRPIENEDRISLGRYNSRLGQDSVAGQRQWLEQAAIRIVIGPIDYAHFLQLLPESDGRAHRALTTLLHFLLHRQCDCRLRFLVRSSSVPRQPLPTVGNDHAPRLGHCAWLSGRSQEDEQQQYRMVDLLIPAFSDADIADAKAREAA